MKQTKEQVIKELTLALKEKVDLQSGDIDKRKALSKMLGASRKFNSFNNDVETYSWPEIYYEVGKLCASVTFYHLDGNVSELEAAVEQMKQNWDKYFAEKK